MRLAMLPLTCHPFLTVLASAAPFPKLKWAKLNGAGVWMQWGRPPAVCSPGGARCHAMPGWEGTARSAGGSVLPGPGRDEQVPREREGKPHPVQNLASLVCEGLVEGLPPPGGSPGPSDRCSCLKRHNDTLA